MSRNGKRIGNADSMRTEASRKLWRARAGHPRRGRWVRSAAALALALAMALPRRRDPGRRFLSSGRQ
jgi:hypothetical protein